MWNIAFSLDFETKVWGVPLLLNSFKQSTNWRRKQRCFRYNFIPYRAAFVNYWEHRVLLCGFWMVVCTTYIVYPVSSNFLSVFQKSNVTQQARYFVKRHNITERNGALHNEKFHSCNSLSDNSNMLNERLWDWRNM
jgi:hypothetical protein